MCTKNNYKCPVCGCEDYTGIGVSDVGGYACLHNRKLGSIFLNACLNCGVVSLDPYYLKRLKEDK